MSIEHLSCDAAFSVCFPEAKVIEEYFIEHIISLQTSQKYDIQWRKLVLILGNFKRPYYLFRL